MPANVLNPALAFGAGVLTILSPCVLPLVPVVLASAAQKHRLGPLALAFGLIASFTSVGLALAVFGARMGVDSETLRLVGAAILALAGIYLLLPRLQDRLAVAATPLVNWAGDRQRQIDGNGLAGQAGIGVLLGVVWSPCVGPTLGAAIALAAQGQQLSAVAVTMTAFAAGIATVLLIIGALGRTLFTRVRGNLMSTGKLGKQLLGAMLLMVGLLILSGADRLVESYFVTNAPGWLIRLTTSL